MSWCWGELRVLSSHILSRSATAPTRIRGKSARRTHPRGYMLEVRVNIGGAAKASSAPSPQPVRHGDNLAADKPVVTGLSWRERVTSALRGVFVTLINTTDVSLRLQTHDVALGSAWLQRPAELVSPSERDTFGAASHWLSGTAATVTWSVEGCERAIVLIINNPYFGPNTFTAQCPDQFRVTIKAHDAHCSGVVMTLARRATLLQGLFSGSGGGGGGGGGASPPASHGGALEEPADMDWARAVLGSPRKLLVAEGRPTLTLLSLACTILPPPLPSTPADPLRRATLLGAALAQAPFDVLCLQEVFWANARSVLRTALAKTFPHVVERTGQQAYGVGVGSGLFVASKLPISWSQFYPFEEGLGSDSLASKGVLLVRLDLAKKPHAPPGACAYVVVTDLQRCGCSLGGIALIDQHRQRPRRQLAVAAGVQWPCTGRAGAPGSGADDWTHAGAAGGGARRQPAGLVRGGARRALAHARGAPPAQRAVAVGHAGAGAASGRSAQQQQDRCSLCRGTARGASLARLQSQSTLPPHARVGISF